MTPEDLNRFSQANRTRCESPMGFNHVLGSWSLSDWFVALLGEIGEAANVAKKLNRIRDGLPGNQHTEEELRKMLAEELADAATYLDLFCQRRGVWLSSSLAATRAAGAGMWFSPVCWAGSDKFVVLASLLGEIATSISTGWSASSGCSIFCCLEQIAELNNIDLYAAMVEKFNAKSREIEYPEEIKP